jgi:branched-chain amino acid transport system permease protein
MFSWQMSGEIIIFIILGGTARLFGPVAGALAFVTLEHFLGALSDYWHIYLGVLLLLFVLFARGGIIGLLSSREKLHE